TCSGWRKHVFDSLVRPPLPRGTAASAECRKTVKTPTTGRKRVTRGTQEGFLSFSIRSFQDFLKF
ncbi:hypothetical protein, partial [uncultured Oscillibacter sp.]|uniref:hypothetical protein n=1 Tax=uncultured Oscillibacter sp. TaxID=876091 RepID=UPI00272E8E9B